MKRPPLPRGASGRRKIYLNDGVACCCCCHQPAGKNMIQWQDPAADAPIRRPLIVTAPQLHAARTDARTCINQSLFVVEAQHIRVYTSYVPSPPHHSATSSQVEALVTVLVKPSAKPPANAEGALVKTELSPHFNLHIINTPVHFNSTLNRKTK